MNRYIKTKIFVDDFVKPNVQRYGIWVVPHIIKNPDVPLKTDQYTNYTVAMGDIGRMDLLAHKFYGDSTLWWVIAYYSGVKNPLTDMYVGQVLVIPSSELVGNMVSGVE